ncbi:hypothetical protein D9756_002611 [Leucocoprinus leucothites]|uniref:Uncharacterized protein n=1 Tax=Leucocoprinus leucothites TaxID=201217 RepID=A0A8H5GBE2_9AGAR|nr:hypothetical protein D9756_002611 [Leucoagaricus leucothites]
MIITENLSKEATIPRRKAHRREKATILRPPHIQQPPQSYQQQGGYYPPQGGYPQQGYAPQPGPQTVYVKILVVPLVVVAWLAWLEYACAAAQKKFAIASSEDKGSDDLSIARTWIFISHIFLFLSYA